MTTDNKQSVLTDAEIDEILDSRGNINYVIEDKKGRLHLFARAIEQAVLSKLRRPGRTPRQDALRISELQEVDEALCNFCNDSTGDNAVALVQAILDAKPQAPSGHKPEPVPVDTSSGHSAPMSRDWKAIEAVIDEYLDGYELRLDEGCHRPTEFERFLIDDAIAGLLAENEFLSLMGSEPQASAEAIPVADCYSNDDGDHWLDCPDDIEFVNGLKVGDEYELQASIRAWPERFRVTKVPDETSDDYEVEPVAIRALKSAPAAEDTAISAGLTAQDVERQYQDGVHIGSGLPRTTCPCGFCARHRHGFNQGDDTRQQDKAMVERVQAMLMDPAVIHINMLRGSIAPITFDQLAHVLGDEATAKWIADRQRRGGDVIGILETHISGEATFWPDAAKVLHLPLGDHSVYVGRAALAARKPVEGDAPDQSALDALINVHQELVEDNPYCYFELAHTRQTGWMAWITDKPLYPAQEIANPDRKVIARGQGDSAEEACRNALAAITQQGKEGA